MTPVPELAIQVIANPEVVLFWTMKLSPAKAGAMTLRIPELPPSSVTWTKKLVYCP